MANIFKKIENTYDKTAKGLNQIWTIVFVLGIGIFLITVVNRSNNTSNNITDNAFLCALTPADEVLKLSTTDLSTVFNLSIVDNEKDLLKTALTKNSIPAVENPRFGKYSEISPCVSKNEPVFVVKYNEIIKIYPRRILEQHIVINDKFGDSPVLIAYSPLSNLYNSFIRTYKNEIITFGVSGYLYKNIDLIFDSKSESLWSIVDGRAIVGSKLGASLEPILTNEIMTLAESIDKYPEGLYMNFDTGFRLNYNSDPFGDYRTNSKTLQQVEEYSDKINSKSNIYGFLIKNKQFYFNPEGLILPYEKEINIDGVKYKLYITTRGASLKESISEKSIQIFSIYWFVWYDLFPQSTEIN